MKNLVLSILLFGVAYIAHSQNKDEVFLFSYFVDNGEDGLHLAYSYDGLKWEALKNNQSFLKPAAGKDKLMRDPCIIQGPDGNFRLVWTLSWNEKGIGYAFSKDLINWSDQYYLPVMEHEPDAKNCWAPEVFYDEKTKQYIIFWSSTIPGRFTETEKSGDDKYNHRMYFVTTTDFMDFTETELFYDQGFNVIDGTMITGNNNYILFLKDETRTPPQKNIRFATSSKLTGGFGKPSAPITGNYWAEGPTLLKTGSNWTLYFDKYTAHKMGAIRSADLETWEDISDSVSFPEGTRHGTAFKVSREVFEKLKTVD